MINKPLQIVGAIIGGLLLVGIVAIGIGLLLNYLTVENDYYANYSDIESERFEREFFPPSFPASAYDIHKQTDSDAGTIWMRFQLPEDDKEHMVAGLEELSENQINSEILIPPARDVDWWFHNLKQLEPKKTDSLDADLYIEECSGVFHEGYYAVDKKGSYIYYWCS